MSIHKYLFILFISSFTVTINTILSAEESCNELIAAISNQNIKKVQEIIFTTTDFPNDSFPLHHALKEFNKLHAHPVKINSLKKIIISLIHSGANKELIDFGGQKPLDIPISYKNVEALIFLLDFYKEPGETELHRLTHIANQYYQQGKHDAVSFLQTVVDQLLKKTPDLINLFDRSGKSALILAVENNNKPLITTLQLLGATPVDYVPAERQLTHATDATTAPIIDRSLKPKPTHTRESDASSNPIPKWSRDSYADLKGPHRTIEENPYLIPGQPVKFD